MRGKLVTYFLLVALNTLTAGLIYSLYNLNDYIETKLEEIRDLKSNFSRQFKEYRETVKFAKSLGIRAIKKDEALRIVLKRINDLKNLGKIRLLSDLNINDRKVSVKLELRFSPKSKKEFKDIIKRILESKEPIIVLKSLSLNNKSDVSKATLRIVIIQPYSE